MKPTLLAASTCLLAFSTAHAASGIFGSYIGITAEGSSEAIYGEQQPGPNFVLGFNSADLGDLNLGETLTISSAEVLTFKNGISDVFGAELNYRVYENGGSAGAFNTVAINFGSNAPFTDFAGNSFSNGGDQSWSNIASTPEVASALTAGDYVLEIFWKATTSDGDQFVNNGGSNYLASFTVVPEPSSYALIAGMLGVCIVALRRRHA